MAGDDVQGGDVSACFQRSASAWILGNNAAAAWQREDGGLQSEGELRLEGVDVDVDLKMKAREGRQGG